MTVARLCGGRSEDEQGERSASSESAHGHTQRGRGGENWRHHARDASRLSPHAVLPPPSTWHLTLPGADRLLELRWAARIRRAQVMTPEQHMAAVADPNRRGADLEIPLGCALCGGRRLQALLHAFDQRPKRGWDYHVVRCAGCGFLFRHPGIRPERLGDLYSSGKYAKFLGGKYRAQAAAPLPGDDAAVRRAVQVRRGPPPARLRLRQRPLPRARAQARLRDATGSTSPRTRSRRRGSTRAARTPTTAPRATSRRSRPAASTSSRCGRCSPTWPSRSRT